MYVCMHASLIAPVDVCVQLAKAFKMVPVMLMGKLLNNKSYDSSEYLSGFTIGAGLFLFLNSSEHIDLRQNVFGDLQGVTGALCGVVLLLLFLLFDSFTGGQGRVSTI